jgi:hypothetical protein
MARRSRPNKRGTVLAAVKDAAYPRGAEPSMETWLERRNKAIAPYEALVVNDYQICQLSL